LIQYRVLCTQRAPVCAHLCLFQTLLGTEMADMAASTFKTAYYLICFHELSVIAPIHFSPRTARSHADSCLTSQNWHKHPYNHCVIINPSSHLSCVSHCFSHLVAGNEG